MKFYCDIVGQITQKLDISKTDNVLVVCGGGYDRAAFQALGFSDVTISNIDTERAPQIAPYDWAHADAENLPFPARSFDLVIVHAGLHHCYSPHRALIEMYRVARKAVIVIEARDSMAMRIARRFALTPDYEIEAVSGNGMSGGVANSAVPNYIYRWTEREIEKTIASAAPQTRHGFLYYYALRLPVERFQRTDRPFARATLIALTPVCHLLAKIFPRQANCFGFAIWREGPQPWITSNSDGKPTLNMDFAAAAGRIYR